MNKGDKVTMRVPGSWIDGRAGTILALNVTSSDEIFGHLIEVPNHGRTVVPEDQLEPFKETSVAEAARKGFYG